MVLKIVCAWCREGPRFQGMRGLRQRPTPHHAQHLRRMPGKGDGGNRELQNPKQRKEKAMTTTTTLEKVIEHIHETSAFHHDETVPVQEMEFDSLKQMWVSGKPVEVMPTAQRLLANRLKVPFTYLERCSGGSPSAKSELLDRAGAEETGYTLLPIRCQSIEGRLSRKDTSHSTTGKSCPK